MLTDSDIEKVKIPKSAVPELPESFTRSVPPNDLQNAGAKDSFRDSRGDDSLHLIEYDDHWRGHIDEYNPKKESVGDGIIDSWVVTTLAPFASEFIEAAEDTDDPVEADVYVVLAAIGYGREIPTDAATRIVKRAKEGSYGY